MKYKIIYKDKVIGITRLEKSDPPMGFVFGILEPTLFYTLATNNADYKIYCDEINEEISCKSIIIEDFSEQLGEQYIEVTILVKSAEEYKRFFKHHWDSYEKQFS